MRLKVSQLYHEIDAQLTTCHEGAVPLPGVQNPTRRDTFIRQLIDSIRRVQFVSTIANRDIHADRANGSSSLFDPIRAAILKHRAGHFDDACWLVFLFVHFGRHPRSGYRYTREVYGALGQRGPWTFEQVSNHPDELRAWLDANEAHLKRGANRGFGNHRKYLSMSGSKPNGTGHAFVTYAQWVNAYGGHQNLFDLALHNSDDSPEAAFEWLYRSMRSVASFGRIGKFDYLTMIQKLHFANIRPGRPYFDSSTKGPNSGARKLLESGTTLSIAELERRTTLVGSVLSVGMQEMEDSLCNWGKDPNSYTYFRG